jgi:hypothetical protein
VGPADGEPACSEECAYSHAQEPNMVEGLTNRRSLLVLWIGTNRAVLEEYADECNMAYEGDDKSEVDGPGDSVADEPLAVSAPGDNRPEQGEVCLFPVSLHSQHKQICGTHQNQRGDQARILVLPLLFRKRKKSTNKSDQRDEYAKVEEPRRDKQPSVQTLRPKRPGAGASRFGAGRGGIHHCIIAWEAGLNREDSSVGPSFLYCNIRNIRSQNRGRPCSVFEGSAAGEAKRWESEF